LYKSLKSASAIAVIASITTGTRKAIQASWRPLTSSGFILFSSKLNVF